MTQKCTKYKEKATDPFVCLGGFERDRKNEREG